MKATKTCAVCGKEVTEGYLFDGKECLCSKECATKFFDNNEGCAEILIDEGNRLVWHEQFDGFKKFDINTPCDVVKFFIWIVFDRHINFHPDDSFGEYENVDEDEPTFSLEEANYYDEVMRQCFVVCENFDRNIYKLAQLVIGTYCYCDCNDEMARFCLGEWD